MKPLLLLSLLILPFCLLAQQQPVLKIKGSVKTELTLSAADLQRMPRATATIKEHDGKDYTFSGVPVQAVLEAAGAPVGKQLNKTTLNTCLLIRCADGYQVAYSLAELDSSFTNNVAIIADQVNGQPLPGNRGPFRFIMPGEKKLARSAFKLEELIVVSIKE
jgi:DMSO/TMAO reductase YedYZ molybdopterin-dependent catalytic subunit